MKRVQLDCGKTAYHTLHTALERVRSTSKSVSVDKAALSALLRDHGKVITALHEEGVETQEGE